MVLILVPIIVNKGIRKPKANQYNVNGSSDLSSQPGAHLKYDEKSIGLKREVTSKRLRSLDTRIYEMNIQFWAVLGSRGCREKKSKLP